MMQQKHDWSVSYQQTHPDILTNRDYFYLDRDNTQRGQSIILKDKYTK